MLNHLINQIHLGDCLEFMREMPDKCVDLVLTDPPFQMGASGGGFAKLRKHFEKIGQYSGLKADWCNPVILHEYARICKSVNIFIFGGRMELFNGMAWAVENGYKFYILPLLKKNPLPLTKNTWLSNEYGLHICDRQILCSLKYADKMPYYLVGSEECRHTKHPNEKPLTFLRQIIRNLTNPGDIVFDPFSGSASTPVAAYREKRRFIGVEINPQYHAESIRRLDLDLKQPGLF